MAVQSSGCLVSTHFLALIGQRVVCKGSQAVLETVPSMPTYVRGMYDIRQKLIESEVLAPQGDHYVFTQDYSFSSPSAAAAVVLGRSANGRVEWKDESGRTLKSIQEEAISGTPNSASE